MRLTLTAAKKAPQNSSKYIRVKASGFSSKNTANTIAKSKIQQGSKRNIERYPKNRAQLSQT